MTMSVRVDQAADLQLLEQQAGHDRLAGAGVVGEQEADARQLQEVVVDRLELVRQRIDAGDREREVRVVLVGQAEPRRPRRRAGSGAIAVEARFFRENGQRREMRRVEDSINERSRLQAPADDSHGAVKPRCGDDFDRLRKERTLKSDARG